MHGGGDVDQQQLEPEDRVLTSELYRVITSRAILCMTRLFFDI